MCIRDRGAGAAGGAGCAGAAGWAGTSATGSSTGSSTGAGHWRARGSCWPGQASSTRTVAFFSAPSSVAVNGNTVRVCGQNLLGA